MTGTNCTVLPEPSLRTAELMANLAALIASVVPFFTAAQGNRAPMNAPAIPKLFAERCRANNREHGANADHGNECKVNIHDATPGLGTRGSFAQFRMRNKGAGVGNVQ